MKVEIEHHFLQKDVLPEEKWIEPTVAIVVESDDMDFFIEDGIGEDTGKAVINSGPLSIKLKKEDLLKAIDKWRNRENEQKSTD